MENTTPRSVAVLGGGVAGLTAADELTRRGYQVTVCEAAGRTAAGLGGKARSFDVTGGDPLYPHGQGEGAADGPDTAPGMFGEHGFRFFPGFYENVIDTMRHIPLDEPGGATVATALQPLDRSMFYTRIPDGLSSEANTPGRPRPTAWTIGAVLFVFWALVGGWIVWYRGASWHHHRTPVWLGWLVAPAVWYLVRMVIFAVTRRGSSSMEIQVPTRPRGSGRANWLITHHRWWRFIVLPAGYLALRAVHHPLRALPFVIGVALVLWLYPLVATVRALWNILQSVPKGVRPATMESAAASLKVAAIVAACKRRTFEQWERDSWWSFISASRYSRPFQLAFATGLTRSFVATRAESMSARTGGTILAQLLYDIAPTLLDRDAADQVLCRPTHDAWIDPWVSDLTRRGVRFNEFHTDGVVQQHESIEVLTLLVDEPPAGLAEWDAHNPPMISGFEFRTSADGAAVVAPHFDHYVLAVSGTAAQDILMRSDRVVAWDRRYSEVTELGDTNYSRRFDRKVPYLDGIFALEFGWMTGLVYHLREPVSLPQAHHLCLESEWALTMIDYSPIWSSHRPDLGAGLEYFDVGPWKSIISVNVSDWFSPSPHSMPANHGDLERVRCETWRQLGEHIESLRDLPVPPFVPDRAVTGADGRPVAQGAARPLRNSERLLINVAGSWHKRPAAQTVFGNMVLAGDYVRTWTDFASMEAANESARRAVNVILHRDEMSGHHTGMTRCTVHQLESPNILKNAITTMRAFDKVAMTLGLPHPIMLLATPLGWLAGLENSLRQKLVPYSEASSRPVERTRRRPPTSPASSAGS